MKNPLHGFLARVSGLRQLIRSINDTANEFIRTHRDHDAAERHALASSVKSRSEGKKMEFFFWRTVAAEIASQRKRAARKKARSGKPEKNGK